MADARSVFAASDPYLWFTPFEALEEAEYFRRRYFSMQDEMEERMRQMHDHHRLAAAGLHAQVEHLTKLAMEALNTQRPPLVIVTMPDGLLPPTEG